MYYTRYYTEQYSGKTKKFLRNINNRWEWNEVC